MLLFLTGFMFGQAIPILAFEHYLFGDERMESQERLIRIHNEVALGDDEANVAKKIIANIATESVYAPIGEADATWDVTSPALDFGFGEWMLFLCFTDSQLDGVQLGTRDSPVSRPRDTPLPKGRSCLE